MTYHGLDLRSVQFSMFSTSDVRALSVVEIKSPLSFNNLGHPFKYGLYDNLMGPYGYESDPCGTCKGNVKFCSGHFGHIELPFPVINPLFFKQLSTLLSLTCTLCFKLQIPDSMKKITTVQLKLVNCGLLTEAQEIKNFVAQLSESQNLEKEIEKCLSFWGVDFTTASTCEPSKATEELRATLIANLFTGKSMVKKCLHCKSIFKHITMENRKFVHSVSAKSNTDQTTEGSTPAKSEDKFLGTEQTRQILRNVWRQEKELLTLVYPVFRSDVEDATDIFYIEAVLVTPPKARPAHILHGKLFEHDQTKLFKNIIQNCMVTRGLLAAAQDRMDLVTEENLALMKVLPGANYPQKLHFSMMELQKFVDELMDNDKYEITRRYGLRQVIEKKEGCVRQNMMGKRVNFAARSVITPDPNIDIDQIGVPEDFAKKLTYPARVTHYNVDELRRMVINGPDVYPGANIVEHKNGVMVMLAGGKENKRRREGVAKVLLKSYEEEGGGKIVHRHLLNGDVLLVNRQPTLHRPSIMAHTARILKHENTLRMHYSNCKAYNADFDGDEMNAHCPQSEIARSEALTIVNVANQYLVPKDGSPLGGLIQDHMISGVKMTVRGQFFNKEDYYQLVYQGLAHTASKIKLLPPAIIKPVKLWSGKQVISTVLLNILPMDKEPITLHSTSKIQDSAWSINSNRASSIKEEMTEAHVIFRKGELVCGVLDKQHYGATSHSLIHCVCELYGGDYSTRLLSSLARVFASFLQTEGFTIGVEDILVKPKQDKKRKHIINELRTVGAGAAAKALGLDEVPDDLKQLLEEKYFQDGVKFRSTVDRQYKSCLDNYTNEINSTCLPGGLQQTFPENNLQLMVMSGAKGSTVNTMQISCLLGQIDLEGQRPPLMLSGRSLPSFKPFDTSPRAGGYVDGRFMTGIRPQEFFFHCMAGREGLVDTAVKTSRSGYLQRCLVKHLEGVIVNYDFTVRDSDGSVLQFAYGEDGMDVTKSTFLQHKYLDILIDNHSAVLDKKVVDSLKEDAAYDHVKDMMKETRSWLSEKEKINKYINPFTLFSRDVKDTIPETYFKKYNKNTGRAKSVNKILKKWKKLDPEEKEKYVAACRKCPDPVTTTYRQDRYYGALTESLDKLLDEYLKSKSQSGCSNKALKMLKKKSVDVVNFKSMNALCHPGEAVGLLAAQSVGEPSTQMTLNTFHFAGRGDMNVTLGIPRLRELLMYATKRTKTPSMEIPFKPSKKLEKKGHQLKKIFQSVRLSDVLEKITVDEELSSTMPSEYLYHIRFDFLPHECYKNEFVVNPKSILKYFETRFLPLFQRKIYITLHNKASSFIEITKDEIKHTKESDDDMLDKETNKDDDVLQSSKKRGVGEEHESSDEDEIAEDEDATHSKMRNKHTDQEYDEDTDNDTDDENELTRLKEEALEIERREESVTSLNTIKSYKYDIQNEEWCEVVVTLPIQENRIDFSYLLKELCTKSNIYSVPNINRAIIYMNKDEQILKTDGINFIEMYKYRKLLDINKLYSNDMQEIAQTYGIEAAGRVIVKEIKDVFRAYGITVNPRHLLLISDYMTFHGNIQAFSRNFLKSCTSTLQQMSFETAISFLKNSILFGKSDYLTSASSRVMVGQPCLAGTGCFDVMPDISYFKSCFEQ